MSPVSPASHRRTAAVAGGALLAALLAPGVPARAATSVKADYTCKLESILVPDAEPFTMPVDASVTARRNGSAVDLTVSTGRPVLPVEAQVEVTLTSMLSATVDGAATSLTGSRKVVVKPATPVDLPVLTGSVTSAATSLRLTPGVLKVTLTYSGLSFPITCTPDTIPTAQVPVEDPAAEPAPAPQPVKPQLTVTLTKKTQKVGKAPAKVKVALAATAKTAPQGSLRVTAGGRKVATRPVTGPTSFRAALPKRLKPGRHAVVVTFTPTKGSAYAATTARTTVRVRR